MPQASHLQGESHFPANSRLHDATESEHQKWDFYLKEEFTKYVLRKGMKRGMRQQMPRIHEPASVSKSLYIRTRIKLSQDTTQ